MKCGIIIEIKQKLQFYKEKSVDIEINIALETINMLLEYLIKRTPTNRLLRIVSLIAIINAFSKKC